MSTITEFMEKNFKHFNAAITLDAAKTYKKFIDDGGKMLIAMGGAMSTAEIGKSLAEMIRQDKVSIISCSANNLEEDIFNLIAHNHYERIQNWRDLTREDDQKLVERHLNRITDTCVPEEYAFRILESHLLEKWQKAEKEGKRYFPYEYFYQLFDNNDLEQYYQIDLKDSWVYAAYEKNIPIFSPGYEDSTTGNMVAAACMRNEITPNVIKNGIEQMISVSEWYIKNSKCETEEENVNIGFFQIGGGISADFAICLVPMLYQDLEMKNVPTWKYFCNITDSTESYGSYSGALGPEKITWGKLSVDTPMFTINSDATIVAPLIFSYVLGE